MEAQSESEETKEAPRRLLLNPQEIVSVFVEDKEFKIYKSFLVRHSEYFQKALNGPFIEARTREIVLRPDITSYDFGVYIDMIHHTYFALDLKLYPLQINGASLEIMLSLWKCSDRFLNTKVFGIAEEVLAELIKKLKLARWEHACQVASEKHIWQNILNLQKVVGRCTEEDLPFRDDIIAACANMPPQLYARAADYLDYDF